LEIAATRCEEHVFAWWFWKKRSICGNHLVMRILLVEGIFASLIKLFMG
jgi:hypothetical protein